MADRDSLEDRVPCSDEMCVGIIGPSGRCGVCGKPGTPQSRSGKIEHPHDDLHRSPEAGQPTERAPEAPPPPSADFDSDADADAADPSDRIPCPDEMCVGILNPQGRCGTCGRQWPTP